MYTIRLHKSDEAMRVIVVHKCIKKVHEVKAFKTVGVITFSSKLNVTKVFYVTFFMQRYVYNINDVIV